MITHGAYFCENGHLWEVTTDTLGHEATSRRSCINCSFDGIEPAPHPYGPYLDLQSAREIAEGRGVVFPEKTRKWEEAKR